MIISLDRKTQILLFFLLLASSLFSQTPDRKVTRCASVSRSAPVHNVFVDGENNKWVASGTGVFQVLGTDLSNSLNLAPGEKSVFSFRGGNADVRWTPEMLQLALNAAPEVSAAWYDERNDWLWLGTTESGLFQLNTKPALKLVNKFTSGNSKLKSNTITTLFQDRTGQYWIGTDDGMMSGTPGKWKSELDGYNVQRIRQFGGDLYILADGEFWAVRGGNNWEAINLKGKSLEGEPEDFDLAPNGNLWILSRMVTRYDLETDEFDVFSGAEYYTSEYGRCIAADLDGAVWVGTDDKGLYLIDKSTALIVNCLVDKELSCTGPGNDAALNVRIEGGKAPYTYAWSAPGLQGATPQNLAAGTYTVTVTDSNGKTKTAKAKIDDPRMELSAAMKQAESGPGKKDGIAEVTVKGGKPEYKYKWDNGETANPAKKLAEGPHTVTVTDANGCTATTGVVLTQKLAALSAQIEETTPIPCSGGNTILKVTVDGGKAPYRYEWSKPQMEGAQPTGVTAGAYQLTVTDAAGGKTTVSYTVAQPASVSVVATAKSPAGTGASDGKATAASRGGAGAYTYRWDNGETTETAVQLKAGPHSVTVTDANGCTATASVTITENILPLQATIEETGKINCAGEQSSLKVNVEGGKSPFAFQWSNTALSGYQPAGVNAGAYTVTVTDAAGGKTTATFTIKQPDALTAGIAVKAPASTGNTDGKAQAQVRGGTPPFQYRWDNGETTELASQLGPGLHSLTVSDVFGCSATATASVSENILPLSASISESAKINCNGGKTGALQAEVNGGKAPFQYQWSNPALTGDKPANIPAGDYTLTVTDAAGGKTTATFKLKQPDPLGASATAKAPAGIGSFDGKAQAQGKGGTPPYLFRWDNDEAGADAVRLNAGTHAFTVTDANGCTATGTVSITENILPLAVSIEETGKINCNGGQSSLKANVSGGKGPFQFSWNTPSLSGDQPTGVPAGDYTLAVTDAAGNKASAAFKVRQPDALKVSATVQSPASTGNADGKAAAKATGGAPPYRYAWDTGENAETALKLGPGAHTFTATDANGCTATGTVSITENILPLAVSIEETGKINCNGGQSSLKANISGGKGPFQFSWNTPSLSGDQPTGVPAGDYTLAVTDAAGNKASAAFKVRQPDALKVSATVQSPASTGNTDGKAAAKATGGAPPYRYAWDTGENAEAALKLDPGAHTFTATDANGCTATGTVSITENILPLSAGVEETGKINCNSGKTGLKVNVSGGKGPFRFQWSNPALSGEQPAGVVAGVYTVTLTDAVGTTATAAFTVKEPPVLTLSGAQTAPASAGNSDGQAKVEAKGGTGAYAYRWDNGETAATAGKLAPGTHTVTVTDANGCTAQFGLAITENILPLEVDVTETGDIKCAGGASGLKVNVKGGKPPFRYKWDNPAWTGAEVNNVPAATYAVLVTDAQGTTQTAVAIVNQPDSLKAEITRVVGATTERSADGKATVKISGGTAPHAIAWNNGETTATAAKLNLGLHGVTVTDANGCSVSKPVEIKQRILPELNASLLKSGQTIKMEQLRFEADSSSLTTDALPTLDELYDFMMENGDIVIEIGGHTNSTPPDEFCDRLSTARAKSAAEYLIGKGIDARRVAYKGYGKRQPIASNSTAEGRRKNQRVEIKILTLKRQ